MFSCSYGSENPSIPLTAPSLTSFGDHHQHLLHTHCELLFLFLTCCMNSPILSWPLALPILSAHSLTLTPYLVSSEPKSWHPAWPEGNIEKAGFSPLTSIPVLFDVHISRAMSTYLPKLKDVFQLSPK